MSEEEDIRLAEAYCQNSLDKSARVQVEERAKSDPAFKQLLNDIQILLAGMQDAGRGEMKSSMELWEQNQSLNSKAKVVSLRAWTAIGIAASVLIATVIYFAVPSDRPDTLALFKEYYQPYPNVVSPLVRGVEDSAVAIDAYRAYSLQKFAEAATLFESMGQKDGGVYFYLGLSYLSAGDLQKSVEPFRMAIETDDLFDEQAQWYLALAYLKSGEEEKCMETLRVVVSDNSMYKPRAEKLLTKLKQI